TAFHLQFVCSRSLIQRQLNEPRASLERKELSRLGFGKVGIEVRDGHPCQTDRESLAQIFAAKISNDVSEFVYAEDGTQHLVAYGARHGKWVSDEIQNAWPHRVDRSSPHQMRCHRRKDVPPVKCLADGFQKQAAVRNVVDLALQNSG